MGLNDRLAYLLSVDTSSATTSFGRVATSAEKAALAQAHLTVAASKVEVAEARTALVAAKAAKDTDAQAAATMRLAAAQRSLASNRAAAQLQAANNELAQTKRGAEGASESMETLGGTAARAGTALAVAYAAGAPIRQFFTGSADAASNLNEQVSATEIIFGGASDSVREFAQSAADNFNMSERAALQYANSYAALFKNAGISEQAAADFSVTLTKLGADISSLRNLNQEDVLQGLRSALTGEVEPARRLGVILNDQIVTARALQMGLGDLNGEVDDGAKVLARASLLIEESSDAWGNAALTSDEAANAQRNLQAQVENFMGKVGQGLTPTVAGATNALADLLSAANKAAGVFGGLGGVIKGIADAAVFNHVRTFNDLVGTGGDNAKEAAEKIKNDYKKAIEDLAETHRVAAVQAKNQKDALDGLDKSSQSLRKAQEGLADSQDGVAKAQGRVAEAQQDLSELQERGAVDAEKVARADERLRSASEGVTRAQRDEVDATRDLAAAQASVLEAQKELEEVRKGTPADKIRKAELDVADALDAQKRAALDLAKAKDDASRIKDVGILGVHDTVAAGQDLARSQLDVASATRQVERADYGAKDAQAELTRLQKVGKEGSDELKDALQKLADRQEAVREQTQKVADAHTNVAKAQKDERAAHDELAEAREGDPEFAEKIADAELRIADAHDAVAKAIRNQRDAIEELAAAEQRRRDAQQDLYNTAAQGAQNIPFASQEKTRFGANGGTTNVTVYAGADANTVARALDQYNGRNGGSPRR